MSSDFYKSIIEEEISCFNIKGDSLKSAAKEVGKIYGQKALQTGETFIDYNIPANRCAYLYKYAVIHTSLGTKTFTKMLRKKNIKSTLKEKKQLKICSLGGGPGTDIFSLFKAMALNPSFHKKVTQVTVLDISGGWRNTFNRVISKLTSGNVKGVPSSFIDPASFKYQLIGVDLLKNLQNDVVSILCDADIICMVKFVSAILGKPSSISAIQNIGSHFKKDAVVLFIDNFKGNVFQPLTEMANLIGLQIVQGPLHENFCPKTGFLRKSVTAAEKEIFGCLPSYATRVSILTLIKNTDSSISIIQNNTKAPSTLKTICEQDKTKDNHTGTTEPISNTAAPKCLTKVSRNKFTQTQFLLSSEDSRGETSAAKRSTEMNCDKSSQTEPVLSAEDPGAEIDILNRLSLLCESLCDFVQVLNQWQKKQVFHNCCHCPCHT